MPRVRAADDYASIRQRMEELSRERQRVFARESLAERMIQEQDAAAHVPAHIVRRYLADARRASSR